MNAPDKTIRRRIRNAVVVVAILLVGAGAGWALGVIDRQSNQLDRRSAAIEYLRADNAWAKCLLREDVGYKAAFLGAVIALQRDDQAEYERLTEQARDQLARYENIDDVCPPPSPPVDPD